MILHNIGRAHFLPEKGGGGYRYYIGLHWIHNTKTGRVPGYRFHYPFGYPGQKIPGNPSTNHARKSTLIALSALALLVLWKDGHLACVT